MKHGTFRSGKRSVKLGREDLVSLIKEVISDQSTAEEFELESDSHEQTSADKEKTIRYEMINPWDEVVSNSDESMVIDLYARGMSVRDIAAHLRINHQIDFSPTAISEITDRVYPLVREWNSRPLASIYPILFLDGIRFKVRDSGKIISKVANIVLGINQYGEKEILGIWISETEGAKFWMHVLTEIRNRGVEDVLIACVDGLSGFPEAIRSIYPLAEIQICITHQIRRTMMFIPMKDRALFCRDLKLIYTAHNETTGKEALAELMERWPKYRSYLQSWEDRWADLVPFFNYTPAIRKIIYTTNQIENLNRQFRRITKTSIIFPSDDSLLKLLWLGQCHITRNWSRSLRDWSEVMGQLLVLFPERMRL